MLILISYNGSSFSTGFLKYSAQLPVRNLPYNDVQLHYDMSTHVSPCDVIGGMTPRYERLILFIGQPPLYELPSDSPVFTS